MTVHLAPNQIVAALNVEFADRLTTPEIKTAVVRIEQRIRQAHPELVALFIKPQTAPSTFARTASAR